MAINRSSAVRSDLPFLARRVKPRAATQAAPAAAASAVPATPPSAAPAAPTAPEPAASARTAPEPAAPAPGSLSLSPSRPAAGPTVSTSLSLGLSPNAQAHSDRAASAPRGQAAAAPSPAAPAAPQRRAPAPLHTRLFPAPGIRDLRTLDSSNPVLRLTPMESAVGTLAVAGSLRAVWEGEGFATGSVSAGEFRQENLFGTMISTPGNRPLVGYEDDLAVIPLRRASMLRRALFFPKPKQAMSVGIYNGESVVVPAKAGERSFYVLSVLRIGNVLELRAEVIPYGLELAAIWESLGFTMSSPSPFQGR